MNSHTVDFLSTVTAVQCKKLCSYKSKASGHVQMKHKWIGMNMNFVTLTVIWLQVPDRLVEIFYKLLITWDFLTKRVLRKPLGL